MKFLRTFTCNQDHEIEEARALIPDAPIFGCCVLHGTNEHPQRIDLYRSNKPHETAEQPFCVYERRDGQLVTDYDVSSPAAAAASSAPKKGKKAKALVLDSASIGAELEMQNMTQGPTT